MLWEELTAQEFPHAVRACGGVCLVSLGVLECHGPHLPLGTDMLVGHRLCAAAAQREPAIVFPPWFLGQVFEARCFPGTINLPPRMLVDLFLTVLDEIGRNGLTRIVAYPAHGGNNALARFVAQCQLAHPRPYQFHVFNPDGGLTPRQRAAERALLTPGGGGHAGESETSLTLAVHPHLVKMSAVGRRTAPPRGRMGRVRGGFNGFGWYADYPENFTGAPHLATAEKGKVLRDHQVAALAAFIRAVKRDRATPALAREFFRRAAAIGQPPAKPRRARMARR